MLTEIEWWGGLLFIWLAFSFWALFIATQWKRIGFQYLYSACSVIFSGAVLAMYFYPLTETNTQYFFYACFGLGVLATLLLMFWPDAEDSEYVDDSSGEDSDDEEGGELLGMIVLMAPMVICLALGAYKALQLYQAMTTGAA